MVEASAQAGAETGGKSIVGIKTRGRPTAPATRTVAAQQKNDRDLLLLRKVAAKDRQAFEELYRHFHPQITRFLNRLVFRQELVEELVNDTLHVVWEKAADFEGRSKVSTWIIGIAYLKGIKALDRLKMMPEQQAAPMAEVEEMEAEGSAIGDLGIAQWIRSGLDQISPEQRSVVELTYFHGCSYLEIAGIMDCPVNTVKTRMFHARRRLSKLLPMLEEQVPGSGFLEQAEDAFEEREQREAVTA